MASTQDLFVQEHQFDFSGGENSVTDKALLQPNQCSVFSNLLPRRGGGATVRGGYKNLGAQLTGKCQWIGELEQPSLQMIGFQQIPSSWYDETMQPRFRIMEQTPRTSDAFYWGSRQKFFQLVLYLVAGYIPASATHGIVWEISTGSGTWLDITASVVGNADHKKLAAAAFPVEAPLSWPDNVNWVPQQVETRGYQYWIRARVTVDLQNGGSDVVHGQRRVVSDSVGQRKVFFVGGTSGYEMPGFTLTRQSNGMSPGVGQPRMGGATFGEYLYYHTGGTAPLKRWNGCRGVTRSNYNNTPVSAGLTAPAALTQTNAGVASGYATAAVIRARLTKLHGPAGILGESPASPSVEVTLGGAGPYRIRWDFSTAKTAAASDDVHGFRIYVTTDLKNVANVNERDRLERFLLIKEILRDDADWTNGYYDDANVARIFTGDATPVLYTNTPPFYPKGVAVGGERLWIWNDSFVAASDIRRGESWNPFLQFKFQGVTGIIWYEGSMIVFQSDRISAIRDINTSLPYTEILVDGLGNVQPESITAIPGGICFMSRLGPARFPTASFLASRDPNDLLIGLGKVFESANFWNSKVAERRLAQGAYFDHRWWIPVDDGSSASYVLTKVGIYSLDGPCWSQAVYTGSTAADSIGALGVVHGTLDHALANRLCLLASPDNLDVGEIWILQYGTSDRWTTNTYDGNQISITLTTRGLAMGAIHRTKAFQKAHARVRFPKLSSNDRVLTADFDADIGSLPSTVVSLHNLAVFPYLYDLKWDPSATGASGGDYLENCPTLTFAASTDSGFDLLGWWLQAELQDVETSFQV